MTHDQNNSPDAGQQPAEEITNPAPESVSTDEPDPKDPWIMVAKILRPHGLRGTFRLKPVTRDVNSLIECPTDEFFVRQNGEIVLKLTRASARIQKDVVCMKFKEVADRSKAEQYTNAELVISEDDRWELPEGEHYIDELAGLSLTDESGHVIGKVIGATSSSQVHDHLEIMVDQFPDQKALLPLIPEFVLNIDKEAGVIKVDLPDGLFD